MFICLLSKRTIPISVRGRHHIGKKTENLGPTSKILMKDVDLQITEICSSQGFLLEPRKNYLQRLQGDLMQKSYLLGPMIWKVMQRNVERYCELANKTTQQLYKVATRCMDDHQFKEEENESVGDLSTVCSQIVLKCLYLARIGRPIFYGL